MKNPEFWEKKLLRFFLDRVHIPEYAGSDAFLNFIKTVADCAISCETSPTLQKRLNNLKNFLLKLVNNDLAYRKRLIFLCWIIKQVDLPASEEDLRWCEGHFARGFCKWSGAGRVTDNS